MVGHNLRLLPVEHKDVPFTGLWIGTWSMGGEGFGPHDLAFSLSTLQEAFAKGFRHFDTAGFYASGRSEELLAKAFSKKRKEIFISTKGGLWRRGRKVWHDASPKALRDALYQSLKRLKTDYIDLFQLHWPDPGVPVDESLGAMEEFKREGLIRFVGVGNLSSQMIRAYIKPGMLIAHQVHFNPVYFETLDSLRAGKEGARCINCVTSPFEQGLLVSPIYLKKRLGKKDVRNRNPLFSDHALKKRLQYFFDKCADEGVSPAASITGWLLAKSEVDVVIPGPRRPEHIHDLLEGIRLDKSCVDLVVSELLQNPKK